MLHKIIHFLKWYIILVILLAAMMAYSIHSSQDRSWESTIKVTLYIFVHYFPFIMLRPTVVFIITYISRCLGNDDFLGTITVAFFATIGINMLFGYILPIELPIPYDAKAAVDVGRGLAGIVGMMLFTVLYFFCGSSGDGDKKN